MAEFVMKHLLSENGKENVVEVASAAVSQEEIGNDMYPPAKRKLTEKGVVFTHRAARRVTLADYRYYDYIVCMDHSNLRLIRNIIGDDTDNKITLLMEWTGISRDVADPWYTGNFEATYQDVLVGCRCMLDKILK